MTTIVNISSKTLLMLPSVQVLGDYSIQFRFRFSSTLKLIDKIINQSSFQICQEKLHGKGYVNLKIVFFLVQWSWNNLTTNALCTTPTFFYNFIIWKISCLAFSRYARSGPKLSLRSTYGRFRLNMTFHFRF